jgi:c(7)-type cytochrome triheme protein
MRLKALVILLLVAAFATVAYAQGRGVLKRAQRPHEYGNVVMNNSSERNNMAPVVYNHWLHRAKYTCRLCHIDLGIGMEANSTGITEEDNLNGLYCGACHEGTIAFGPEEKDKEGNVVKNCYLCHSYGRKVKFRKNFYQFTKGWPKSRFGNRVDWLQVEARGLVELTDYLEGYSIRRKALKQTKDINIKSKELGIPDIIFSHKKHTVWMGCEVCHPAIFGVKKGSTKFSMQDIFDGKFCGSCHGKVAFPNTDCQLCHTTDVY